MATARVITSPEDLKKYDHWIKSHPHGNLWQSLEWKKYQEALGREVRIYVGEEKGEIQTSALVVIDRTTFGVSTWDIPRGPLSDFRLMETIIRDAKKNKCMSLYLSPPESLQKTNDKLRISHRHEQPEATRVIDLTKTHDEILTQMKSKGRYNIVVAQKHGI